MTRSGNVAMGVTQRPLNSVYVDHPSHTASLLYGLNSLRLKGLLLDVTLIANGERFQAHRVVLASCSDYFRAMFTDEMKEKCQSEICLNGVTAVGLRGLLDYAYTSRLCLNLANILDTLAAAAHLQVLTVVQACSNYLQAQLDLDNCVDVATLAETYSLTALRKKAYAFICAHLHQFSALSDFQRLLPMQLLHLLSCDYPVDCSETQVLQAVMSWLQHSWADRKCNAKRLLSCINWNEVNPTVAERVCGVMNVESVVCLFSTPKPLTDSIPQGVINSRGLEQAVIKVGGFSISGITNEITYFLPSVGRWRHLTTIPHVEQCNFGTAVLNNELYVVGGCFNQSLQENIHPFGFRYNPQHNKWSTMAPMQRERCRFSLSVVDGRLFAIGGASESQEGGLAPLAEDSPCEVYDPKSDAWTPVPSLPGPRAQHAATTLGHTLLITGGLEGERVLDTCVAYNTRTRQWEPRAPMLTPRTDHSCVTFEGKVYICGGWYEDEVTNSRVLVDTIDCYNSKTDSWEVVTTVPTPRFHSGIVIIGSCLYVIGGFHSDATFDRATGVIERYDVKRREWTGQSSYPQDIWEHVCVPLYVPRYRDDMEVMSISK